MATLESIRVVFENVETLGGAELGLNADSTETPGRDLVGDPGEVHGDEGCDDVVPDRFPTQTSHHGVQVVQQLRGHVLGSHLQPPLHHRRGAELRQAGHRAQTVPESASLCAGAETVGTHLQAVQSEIIKVQVEQSGCWLTATSWLPQSREGARKVCQIVVVGREVFQSGEFPQRWRQTLDVVLAEVQTD